MDEEVDFGDDESEEEVDAEECGRDASPDPPMAPVAVPDGAVAPAASSGEVVESSKPQCPDMEEKQAAPNSADRAAAWRQDLEDLDEAEPIAYSFRNGGSCSSTAAVAEVGKTRFHPEDVPQRAVAEQLRETARPLAPGMQRLESEAASPQPEAEWKPPWSLGQAPWQKGRDSSKSGRPKMSLHSPTWEPWLLQHRQHKPTHMTAHMPKNGSSQHQSQGGPWPGAGHAGAGYGSRRPAFAYAPKVTARPPPPGLSRAGPYGFRTVPLPPPPPSAEERLSETRVATSSSSPAKVPHKAAPKSMKMRLAKAKGAQPHPPKSPPPVAEPVPWAPPLHSEAPIDVGTASPSPSYSRSRSRSPIPTTSRTRPPATEACHEVSLSSEEEDDGDHRENGPAGQREDKASACLNEVDLEPDDAESEDDAAEEGGADEAAEENEALNVADAAAAEEDEEDEAAEADEARFTPGELLRRMRGYSQAVPQAEPQADVLAEAEAAHAEIGVIEDADMAEVEEAEAREMEDDLVDMSGLDAAAYEVEEASEAVEAEDFETAEAVEMAQLEAAEVVETSDAIEATEATEATQAIEAAEAVDEDVLAETAEADAFDAVEPNTAGADAAEAGAPDLDIYPNSWLLAEGALEPVPELQEGEVDADLFEEHAVQEPVVDSHGVEEAMETDEVTLHDLIGDEVDIDEEEEREEEEQAEGPEEQQEQEEYADEDGMDAEAEALLRAEAQRAESSTVTIIDDDDEDFFVDTAGGDVQSEDVASPMLRQEAGSTSAVQVQVPDAARPVRQVEPKKAPSAPWTRARLPNFRGVHRR